MKYTKEQTIQRIKDLNITDIHIDGGNTSTDSLEVINDVLDTIESANKHFCSFEELKERLGIHNSCKNPKCNYEVLPTLNICTKCGTIQDNKEKK
jgi:hypothetical protein